MRLFGEEYKRDELLRKVGSLGQLGGARLVELSEGKAKGVLCVEFETGSGLSFTALADRGLDIAEARYRGMSLCWHSPTGVVAPQFYEPEGLEWLRSFYGGLLVTCGLEHAGAPAENEEGSYGLHGRYSNTPASELSFDNRWEADEYIMSVRGTVREARVFGHNLVLRRTITAKLGERRLFIEDVVANEGFEPAPHMILYHINAGFPVVDEGSELIGPTLEAEPRDEEAEEEKESFNRFHNPRPGYKEKCYFHTMKPDDEGFVTVAVVNRGNFGLYVRYNHTELPYYVEWKMMGEGTYVVGMEPANAKLLPRSELKEKGMLPYLQPGEGRNYHLEIGVVEGEEEVEQIRLKAKTCAGD